MNKKFKLVTLSIASLGLVSCGGGFLSDDNLSDSENATFDMGNASTSGDGSKVGGNTNTPSGGNSGTTTPTDDNTLDESTTVNDENNTLVNLSFKVDGITASSDSYFENNTKPTFEGKTPTKEHPDPNKVYKFVGWSTDPKATVGKPIEELPALHGSATYHAIFEEKDAIEISFYSQYKDSSTIDEDFSMLASSNGVQKYDDKFLMFRRKYAIGDAPVIDDVIEDVRIESKHKTAYCYNFTLTERTKYTLRFSGADQNYFTTNYKYEKGKTLNLPVIPENTTTYKTDEGVTFESYFYTIDFSTTTDQCNVYFKNGDEYILNDRTSFNDDYGNPCYKCTYGVKPVYLDDGNVLNVTNPVRITGTKMYKFAGWSTNPNATPSEAIQESNFPAVTGDITYYAIFNTEPTDVFGMVTTSNATKYYTKEEAKTVTQYFRFNTDYTEVGIPNNLGDTATVKEIQLFLGDDIKSVGNLSSSKLTRINLSNSITTIKADLFEGSNRLEYVQLGNNTTTIAKDAFKDCTSLDTVKGGKITSVGESAFDGCKKLRVIDTSNVTSVGTKAFRGCSSLKFNFPKITSLGTEAFSGGALQGQELTLPTSIKTYTTSLGSFVDSGITKLTVPSSITKLETKSFANCNRLNEVVIQGSNTVLEGNPFYGSNNITKFTLNSSSNYKSVDGQLISKNGALIHASNNVEEIDSSVKTIQTDAIYKTDITTLKVPTSVTKFEKNSIWSNISSLRYAGSLSTFNSALETNSVHAYNQDAKINVLCVDGKRVLTYFN